MLPEATCNHWEGVDVKIRKSVESAIDSIDATLDEIGSIRHDVFVVALALLMEAKSVLKEYVNET